MSSSNISLYLPEEVINALNDEAEKQLRSQSNMAELIFRDYFKKGKKLVKLTKSSPEEGEIFNYWKIAMGRSNQTKLTPGRAAKIRARLDQGYTPDQIRAAIDGCKNTPHNMGQNQQGVMYNDIELICRNGENVERFAGNLIRVVQPQAIEGPSKSSRSISALDQMNNKSWAE